MKLYPAGSWTHYQCRGKQAGREDIKVLVLISSKYSESIKKKKSYHYHDKLARWCHTRYSTCVLLLCTHSLIYEGETCPYFTDNTTGIKKVRADLPKIPPMLLNDS